MLLERYEEEGEAFLKHKARGRKKWIHHFEPEGKRQIKHWEKL
jgi:hypothetical protein